MKLIIFGATGTIGRHLVKQALDQGHHVVAFARQPEALELEHPRLTLTAGDVFNVNAVADAVAGKEGVMIALGSAKLTGKVRSVGTQNIVSAMESHGVKRLICQTTLGVGESRGNLNFFWKYLMFGLLLRSVFNDHVTQEEVLRRSNLDWTIVRPAAFTDDAGDAGEGNFHHGFAATERKLSLKIARQDVARFMLQQLLSDSYLRQSPGLSY